MLKNISREMLFRPVLKGLHDKFCFLFDLTGRAAIVIGGAGILGQRGLFKKCLTEILD
jgi:hypothetical protein